MGKILFSKNLVAGADAASLPLGLTIIFIAGCGTQGYASHETVEIGRFAITLHLSSICAIICLGF